MLHSDMSPRGRNWPRLLREYRQFRRPPRGRSRTRGSRSLRRNKMKMKILAATLLTAAATTSAIPADTYSPAISATVLGRCKFTQAAGATLTITNVLGGIDPSAAGPAGGTVNITYKCTTGQAPAFTTDTGTHASGGSNRVADAGNANFMIYTLGLAGGGNGAGFG